MGGSSGRAPQGHGDGPGTVKVASFGTQLSLSALVMGGVVAGLFLLGQERARSSSAEDAFGSNTSRQSATPPLARAGASGPGIGARALLPARSWLVVDFDGRLTGASPFTSSAGPCRSVPPPERVGLALGSEGSSALLLVSPAVSPEFWSCVRAEVLAAGGRALPAEPDHEALESPSGVLVHREGRLLFSSDRRQLSELAMLARGQGESAASAAPHAQLTSALAEPAGILTRGGAPLWATLHVPPTWLADLGPEAQKTPLRHLRAGALRADRDGGAAGALECSEPGCEELAGFLVRARSDLAELLPPPLGEATAQSWSASHQRLSPTAGLIRLRWSPTRLPFSDWVSGLWTFVSRAGSEAPPVGIPPAAPYSEVHSR